MPLTPITDYAPGDIIPSAWANTLKANQAALNARTGGDPPTAGRFLVSVDAATGSWRLLQSGDFSDGLIPDAALAVPKVDRLAPTVTTFAAAGNLLAGFARISNGGAPVADAPSAGTDWYLIQHRHPNTGVDYRWQFACDISLQNETYTRLIVNGTPGPWRLLFHGGNLDPVLRSGGTMTSDLGITRSGSGQPTRGYLILGSNGAYYVGFDGVKHVISTPLLHVTGDMVAYRSGTPGIGYLLLGNAGTTYLGNDGTQIVLQTPAGQVTVRDGVITGLQLHLNATGGTPPLVIPSSNALCPNLNADLLDGMHAADIIASAASGGVPTGIGGYWTGAAAAIPAGWARNANANGRILVGDGTTFGQAFVSNTPYGASWGHDHVFNHSHLLGNHTHDLGGHIHGLAGHVHSGVNHNHSGAPMSASGNTGGPAGTGTGGGTGATFADGSHTHGFGAGIAGNTANDGGGNTGGPGPGNTDGPSGASGANNGASAGVNGTTSTNPTSWIPPTWGVIWVVKT